MKSFHDILENISAIVDTYHGGEYRNLTEMHRNLSSCMYYLTQHQVQFNLDWNREYYNYKEPEGKTSAASKERHADRMVPELYQCRKIMDAAKNISISISYELK